MVDRGTFAAAAVAAPGEGSLTTEPPRAAGGGAGANQDRRGRSPARSAPTLESLLGVLRGEPGGSPPDSAEVFPAVLAAVRRYLDMDVAYIAEMRDGRRRFCAVDSAAGAPAPAVGHSDPAAGTYCQRVLDGRLPSVVPDTSREPATWRLPATHRFGVGSHIGVPIRFADGRVFGTFCCRSSRPNYSLRERDAAVLALFAEALAGCLEREEAEARGRDIVLDRIETALSGDDGLRMVFQPIVDLTTEQVCGFEALARFPADSDRPPHMLFAEAAEVGMGVELELAAVRSALAHVPNLPDGTYLSVNVSEATLASGELREVIAETPSERIVLELTEHSPVVDYNSLHEPLAELRGGGVRLAVDDAGAGYSSLQHILGLHPDIIKLDLSLTRRIARDPTRQAMAWALSWFARRAGAALVAEGIETAQDLDMLSSMGVRFGQGFHLGKPAERLVTGILGGARRAASLAARRAVPAVG